MSHLTTLDMIQSIVVILKRLRHILRYDCNGNSCVHFYLLNSSVWFTSEHRIVGSIVSSKNLIKMFFTFKFVTNDLEVDVSGNRQFGKFVAIRTRKCLLLLLNGSDRGVIEVGW